MRESADAGSDIVALDEAGRRHSTGRGEQAASVCDDAADSVVVPTCSGGTGKPYLESNRAG